MERNSGANSFSATSLDPYTRLLAALADLTTNARAHMCQTYWGCTLMVALLFLLAASIWAFLVLSAVIWVPTSFCFATLYVTAMFCRSLAAVATRAAREARTLARQWGGAALEMLERSREKAEDGVRQRGTEAALKDPGFMRALFEALPGVDPDQALERVDALTRYNLVTQSQGGAERGNLAPGRRAGHGSDPQRHAGPKSSSSTREREDRSGNEDTDGSESEDADDSSNSDEDMGAVSSNGGLGRDGCLSPLSELASKGLLEGMDGAWQAPRSNGGPLGKDLREGVAKAQGRSRLVVGRDPRPSRVTRVGVEVRGKCYRTGSLAAEVGSVSMRFADKFI